MSTVICLHVFIYLCLAIKGLNLMFDVKRMKTTLHILPIFNQIKFYCSPIFLHPTQIP